MNDQLAKVYFPNDLEDAIDRYQELLFKHKQFYFSRLPIPKLTEKKIQELEKFHQAFCHLFPEHAPLKNDLLTEKINIEGNVLTKFLQIEGLRAKFRSEISKTNNAAFFSQILKTWLDTEALYAQLFLETFDMKIDNQEPDSQVDIMALHQELKTLDDTRITHFSTTKFTELPKQLKREILRCKRFLELESESKYF